MAGEGGASAAIVGLIVFQGAQYMSSQAPKAGELRQADPYDTSVRLHLQGGEIAGAIPILAAGAAYAWLAHDPRVLIVSAATAALLIVVNEALLSRS